MFEAELLEFKKLHDGHYGACREMDKSIKIMVVNDPTKYLPNDEIFATNNLNWIFHDVDQFYGQYNSDGTLFRKCICRGCSIYMFHPENMPRIDNGHCQCCICASCVCFARYDNKKYTTDIINPSKNACGVDFPGEVKHYCEVCKNIIDAKIVLFYRLYRISINCIKQFFFYKFTIYFTCIR